MSHGARWYRILADAGGAYDGQPSAGGGILVPKMPLARDHHGQLILHAIVDRVLVTDGTSGLYKGGDAGRVGYLYTIIKGEEGIGCQHGSFQGELELFGFGDGLPQGIDTAGLSAAFTYQLTIFYEGDSV